MAPTRSSYLRIILWLWLGLVAFVLGNVFFFWAISANLFGWFGEFPTTDKLLNPKSELATEIWSEDNKLIGKYFTENRTKVKYEDISGNLIKALYATEDIRFDEHSGIDLQGILGLFWSATQGKPRGGSTITQQLAKNLFDTRAEEYSGSFSTVPGIGMSIIKAKEWIVAIRLERSYSKKEILTMYLNTVDFGSNTFGIEVAAKTFFNTKPSALTVDQAALLVGMLKAPSLYSPVYRKERALARRNVVLGQMHKYGFLLEVELTKLQAKPIVLTYNVESHNDGSATYFRSEVRRELLAFCKEQKLNLYADGLKIYTTINSNIQRAAEQALAKHMRKQQSDFDKQWAGRNPWCDEDGKEIKDFIKNAAKRSEKYKQLVNEFKGDKEAAWSEMNTKVKMRVFSWASDTGVAKIMSPFDSIAYYKRFLHAGLLSVDPHNGYIKAWVGGINFRYFKYDHVRQGRRQPGSAFKPILYATCIDNGFGPCHEMVDAPVTFHNEDNNTDWTPKNSDDVYTGERMSLRKAMAQSINSIAAGMLKQVGIPAVIDMAKRLGIQSPIDPVPPLILGSSDLSVYELVGAYATFVNKGTYIKPFFVKRIEDKNGNVLKTFVPEKRDAITPEVAYTMVHMLKGTTTERNGTALGLYRLGKTLIGNEVGAKTGTTSNYSDGWFVGCTRDLVTGIWVGGDDRSIHFRSSNYGQGARMAMPIWSYFMDSVYANPATRITKGNFEKPPNFNIELNCKELKLLNLETDTAGKKVYQTPQSKDLKDEY